MIAPPHMFVPIDRAIVCTAAHGLPHIGNLVFVLAGKIENIAFEIHHSWVWVFFL
jgi:hypothetical protein